MHIFYTLPDIQMLRLGGEQLLHRRCILEYIREMFTVYRNRKWQQVQACIKSITSAAYASVLLDDASDHAVSDRSSPQSTVDDGTIPRVYSTSVDSDDSEEGDSYTTDTSEGATTLIQCLTRDTCSCQRSAWGTVNIPLLYYVIMCFILLLCCKHWSLLMMLAVEIKYYRNQLMCDLIFIYTWNPDTKLRRIKSRQTRTTTSGAMDI